MENNFELIPCPYCGCKNLVVIERKRHQGKADGNKKSSFAVMCDYRQGGCGANGGRRGSELEAKMVWNHRVTLVKVEDDESKET